MQHGEFCTIPATDVVFSEAWRWRKTPVPARLRRSVAAAGVLTPVLVLRADTGWELVDGHRRLSLRADPQTDMPARVAPEAGAAWRWKVAMDMAVDPYTELEKAGIAVALLDTGRIDEETAAVELLPMLGLKPGKRTLAACRHAASLPPSLLDMLLERKAPLVFAEMLAREDDADLRHLAAWLQPLRLSLSRLMSVVDDVLSIRDRDGVSLPVLLQSLDPADPLADLARRRHPDSVAFRNRVNAALNRYRDLLSFPDDLEGDAYQLTATVRRPQDLASLIDRLHRMASDDALFTPLKELRGDD